MLMVKVGEKETWIVWNEEEGYVGWSLNGFSEHHAAVTIIALSIDKSGLEGDQRELLMSSFNKEEFTHNRRTNQRLCFVSGQGLSVKLSNDKLPLPVCNIPFNIDCVRWRGADVYIYLQEDPFRKTRALISFSFVADGDYFKLDKFSLVNPQQLLASFLTPDNPEWHSAVYAKLFKGFETESGGKFNFIISGSGVVSLVNRTSTGSCMQIDGLRYTGFNIFPGLLQLVLIDNGVFVIAYWFLEGNNSIIYDDSRAFDCYGDVIGLDQLYYH
eukprot:GHVS01004201.1.p1 GENE.GHVS01004201.1~~GHVS01004201.1.p1  ORF type:complete len:313 (+),score=13.87 GHVS01004201.1:128-940(+)